MINIVSFNGGRGARNLFSNLLTIDGIQLTSIVNAYDDGLSTGNVRTFFRMLGPSDIRKVQEVMVPKSLADYDAIMDFYKFRYPTPSDRPAIMCELNQFAKRQSNRVAGVEFRDNTIRETLRVLFSCLVKSIDLIEKAEGTLINFDDCSIMNLVYAGAFVHCGGDFGRATFFIDKLFRLQGTVLPTNNEDKKLVAIREDGTVLFSEAEIVALRSNSRIKKIYLLDAYPDRDLIGRLSAAEAESYMEMRNRRVTITSKVARSISDADIIIYSPGTQHSSLYPSYLSQGVTDAIVGNNEALKVFITNIGEDYETPRYTAEDLINGAVRYLRMGTTHQVAVSDLISVALVNNSFSNKKKEKYVRHNLAKLCEIGCGISVDGYEDPANHGKHDGRKLADFIMTQYHENLSKTCYQPPTTS